MKSLHTAFSFAPPSILSLTSCQIGQPFCIFEEPLLLLNDFEKIDLPIMYLTAGKKRVLDIENYRQEVVKKIQALHSNQSS